MTALLLEFLLKSSLFLIPVLVIAGWRGLSAAERHAFAFAGLLSLPVIAVVGGLMEWRLPLGLPGAAPPTRVLEQTAPVLPLASGAVSVGDVGVTAAPPWLIGYLLVTAALLLWAGASWLRIRRHVATLAGVEGPVWLAEMAAGVTLRWGAGASPWTWGVWRPVLVLPTAFCAWPTTTQLQALHHELAHVNRHDCLTQLIGHGLTILFWFHPLAWLLRRRLARLAEQACDDHVVSLGFARLDYAECLLAIARSGNDGSATGLAMSRHPLGRRVDAILDTSRRRTPMKTRRLVVVLSLALFAAVPVAAVAPETALPDQRRYLPVVKVAPVYPQAAQDRKVEGYAVLELTITEQGTTRNVRIVEESPAGVFGESAVNAARQFLYVPARQGGTPVAVHGVRNRLTYELARGSDGAIREEVRIDWDSAQTSLESSLAAAGAVDAAVVARAAAAAGAEQRRHQRLLSALMERAEAEASRTGNGELYLQAAHLAVTLNETGHAIHALLRASRLGVDDPQAIKVELASLLVDSGRAGAAASLFAGDAADSELAGRWLAHLEQEERRQNALYAALAQELQAPSR